MDEWLLDFVLGLQRKWNELQNTSRDSPIVVNYLLIRYRAAGAHDGATIGQFRGTFRLNTWMLLPQPWPTNISIL